jgi:hypothetical protein
MRLSAKLRHHLERQMIKRGLVWPMLPILASEIEEVSAPPLADGQRRITLLALNPDRFNTDLDILASTGRFRILRFPFDYQALVLLAFYRADQRADKIRFYAPASDDVALLSARSRCRRYLRRLLPKLFAKLGVDAVMSAAFSYRQDFELGSVADETGTPWFVMHSECFKPSIGHQRDLVKLGQSFGQFTGTKLLVHNDLARDLFIESGYVTEDKALTSGCLRMDEFVKGLANGKSHTKSKRKTVVFFSFFHGICLGTNLDLAQKKLKGNWSSDGITGFVKLFEGCHLALAELASEHPEIDVIIKCKWGQGWFERIRDAMGEGGLDSDNIPNLTLVDDVPAHDLIDRADVVVSFGSTTLAEAGIAGKPIVFPYFAEVHRPEYTNHVFCRDDLHLFDVAESPEMIKALVVRRLEDPVVDPEIMRDRLEFFERYVCKADGNSVDRYARQIEEAVMDSRLNGQQAAE